MQVHLDGSILYTIVEMAVQGAALLNTTRV